MRSLLCNDFQVLHAEQQRLVVIVGETDDMRVMAR